VARPGYGHGHAPVIAMRFHNSLPRLVETALLSRLTWRACISGLSLVRLEELPEPALPTDDWVRVRAWRASDRAM
jgi:hypothetical protein